MFDDSTSTLLNSTVNTQSYTSGLEESLIPNTQLNQTLTGSSTAVSANTLEASAQTITNSIIDLAGNTLEAARAITVGATPRTFSDWVGSTDINDYYRFSLNNTSGLNLVLDGLTNNADVQLLNSNGQVIDRSFNTGTTAESIIRQLNSGTYYLRVFRRSAGTDYHLTLSATRDLAGNTFEMARAIGVNATTRTFTDGVGEADPNDYYRFTLNRNSSLNLTLEGLTNNADVQLLNSNGQVIDRSFNTETIDENITRSLDAGTYYVRVFRRTGETFYNLGLSAIRDLAGNTFDTAREIGVNATDRTFHDWVGETDSNDYYRFSLNRSSTFNLTLDELTADADVQLFDSNRNLIQGSWNWNTEPETLNTYLDAGTYYVQVFPYSGETYYSLTMNATPFVPPDYAGNDFSTAREITVTSDITSYEDWVGSADTSDYYSFTLYNPDHFSLLLDNGGTNGYTAVDLFDSNGNWIDWSYSGYGYSGYIDTYLEAGDYYIGVYPYYNADSFYTLSVSTDYIAYPLSSPTQNEKEIATPVLPTNMRAS